MFSVEHALGRKVDILVDAVHALGCFEDVESNELVEWLAARGLLFVLLVPVCVGGGGGVGGLRWAGRDE